ncbi:MAG: (4Fe-4S)-binding protein, partial [Thermoplasmata archaeon]
IVTEPTESGLSDAQRILELAKGFEITTGLVTNKADINLDLTELIEERAAAAGAHLLGRIPYDDVLVRTMAEGKTAGEGVDSPATRAMSEIHKRMMALIAKA